MEIATQLKIKTVILSNRGPIYLTGNGLGDVDDKNWSISASNQPSVKDFAKVFEAGMRETLERLQQAKKQIIVILDVPELGFDPKTCVERPLSPTGKEPKSPCAVPRKDFEARNKTYRDLVTSVAKDYPNVTIFDAAAPFCDDTWCWAMKDGQMFYRDDDHLSVEGSRFLAKELIKVLQ